MNGSIAKIPVGGTFSRVVGSVLVLFLLVIKTHGEPSSNSVAQLAAKCRGLASFLGNSISATTDVERLVAEGRVSDYAEGLRLLNVETENCAFLLDTNRASVVFYRERLVKQASLSRALPTPDEIRLHLCPNTEFDEPLTHSLRGTRFYSWRRKAGAVLIEKQVLMVSIDEATGSCLEFHDFVTQRPIEVRIPNDFDSEIWKKNAQAYVRIHWNWLASHCIGVPPSLFKAELKANSIRFYYTGGSRLVCRYPFTVWEKGKDSSEIRTDPGPFFIDVDVGKRRIIKPDVIR